MSQQLHFEVAHARQLEIVSRAINSHRSHARRTDIDRHRSVGHRLVQVVAVLGVGVAAGIPFTVTGAHSNQRPMNQHAGHVSAQQLAREIRSLETKGYAPASCTVGGTLMRNYSTGQSVTVKS
jgi:hypothetical protein